ncbi:MAG: hypothetical protein ACLFR1_02655 [Spirochaetia bacterium]
MAKQKYWILPNQVAAKEIEAVLTDEGIPYVLVDYTSTPYNGLFTPQMGYGHIEVPSEYFQEAQEVFEDFGIDVSERKK